MPRNSGSLSNRPQVPRVWAGSQHRRLHRREPHLSTGVLCPVLRADQSAYPFMGFDRDPWVWSHPQSFGPAAKRGSRCLLAGYQGLSGRGSSMAYGVHQWMDSKDTRRNEEKGFRHGGSLPLYPRSPGDGSAGSHRSSPGPNRPGYSFTLLAFFPEYRMKEYRSPTREEMVEAFQAAKGTGLKKMRLGNTGVFAHTEDQIQTLRQKVGMGHF